MKQQKMILAGALMAFALTSFAQRGGDKVGGGGDDSEMRVNEIRKDILEWIEKGGSKGLDFKNLLTQAEYDQKMKEILQPQKVVLAFVQKDHPTDEELQVVVDGKPKTCRGFISKKDNRPTILCSIGRFNDTKEAAQYRLIHHEYAGLVGVEQNDGAASDYFLSEQLTDYLVPHTVLRLAIKKKEVRREVGPAVVFEYPTSGGQLFRAYIWNYRSGVEANYICQALTNNQKTTAIKFKRERLTMKEMSRSFPAVRNGASFTLRYGIPGDYYGGVWYESQDYKSSKKVRIFSSITCQ